MLYVLYNSLSKSGKNQNKIYNIVSLVVKKINDPILNVLDMIKIKNYKKFLEKINNEDKIVIIGGDGTLTHITNILRLVKNNPEIYAYKAGTGNDFLRNISVNKNVIKVAQNLYKINPFIRNLPIIKSNNLERSFLNGVGFGVDALIAKTTNEKKDNNEKASFFKVAIDSLKKYKKLQNIKITVDGKEYIYNNVYLVSIMNGPYYGKGMKIAPKANLLSDKLCVIVIHSMKLAKLLAAFALVYSGLHTKIKNVEQLFGREIKIENIPSNFSQIDGEIFETGKVIEFKK
ncbi:diacylglycerol/lipid kinase family protein [Mycoplasmopsis arginini]|uniref:Lipid kinase YegS n=1 Tax=Mycoplasmopsis arginini TaxID=2094 RepID=A0A7Z7D2C3_MYCAR|nr:diacylglycerol kinase family protein [Mycoplasmopsis arginini]SGA02252.1 Putative lipid kinase YtlR [Chlamydia abortus]MDI3348058.1 lipid kinase YegS [Mycoplasmopsis arginini]MDI3348645.1 lipid kinase YegS [Mycoplasmopsis arginini]MDI3349497.1 lipid kinase YegS [Mycoplasmopsis arginini]MDI3351120.1 lipid kinase YegS [Mycoplasmopsis arginini]